MIDSKNILALLGIPAEDVAYCDFAELGKGHSIIELTLVRRDEKCPFCNSNNVVVHGYYNVCVNNSIIRAHNTYVHIEMRRYKCKNCGKTFKQHFMFYMPHKQRSRAMEIAIIKDLKQRLTYSYIAKQYDLSVNEVINIFDSLPRQPKLAFPSCICVDEFHFSNQKNKKCKFPFVITDPFNSSIIDIIESRTWPYLNEYFMNISLRDRLNVKYFVSDMNETYRTLKRVYFKDAIHIIDHFHISKLFNNAIQKIRTKIMKSYEKGTKEYGFLKKNWKLFVCNRARLKEFKRINKRTGEVHYWDDEVDLVLKKYPELNEAYQAREEFNKYSTKMHYWEESRRNLIFFINKFRASSLEELNDIAKTFTNWFDEIVNSYAKNTVHFCLTNAYAEANNNNIQTLIDLGYGYGNFERLRNRVLYINRDERKTRPE